ncbi:hypothetical protein BGZ46_008656 [Entomortierella lignicola]|nr:hypothetical protein BGZ46_008656 [Entomortierella lignicola]
MSPDILKTLRSRATKRVRNQTESTSTTQYQYPRFRTSASKFEAKTARPPVFASTQNDFDKSMPIVRRGQKRKSNSQKPSSRKIKRNVASRRARRQAANEAAADVANISDNANGTNTENSKKGRKRNVGNMVGDVLNSNFNIVTLNIGTITPRLRNGLDKNYQAEDPSIATCIESTLSELAKLNTDLIRRGILVTFNYINHVMAEHPSVTENIAERDNLRHIADDKFPFFQLLVKSLYKKEPVSSKDPSLGTVLEAIKLFDEIPGDKDIMGETIKITSKMEHQYTF